MKTILAILGASMFLFSLRSSAQQEAIPTYTPGSGLVGYSTNGAGYAFTPNVAIAVTALGFDSTQLIAQGVPFQVSLFNAAGATLATATVTPSDDLYDQTYYQSVAPVDLIPGNVYYLGAVAPSLGVWVGNLDGSPEGGGSFSVNSDITYLNSDIGLMPPNGAVPGTLESSSLFFVGENFEFSAVPEPSTLALISVATLLGMARRR